MEACPCFLNPCRLMLLCAGMNRYGMSHLKTEEIKAVLSRHKEVVSVLLLVFIASIHLPFKIHSPLFFLLCLLIFLYKNEVAVKKEFRLLFYIHGHGHGLYGIAQCRGHWAGNALGEAKSWIAHK